MELPDFEENPGSLDLISPTSYFKGEFRYSAFARIDGKFQGTITAFTPAQKSLLVISRMARVEADIHCNNIVIEGVLHGNISSHGTVEIKENGAFMGNMQTKSLIIRPGALFESKCEMERVRKQDTKPINRTPNT